MKTKKNLLTKAVSLLLSLCVITGVLQSFTLTTYSASAPEVTLYSDSSYMVKAFNEGWIDGWLKRGWKAAGGGDVKNQDLWKALIYEVNKHEVTFVWVKGHDESEFNNRCDRLAVEAIKQCRNNNGTEE